MRAAYGNRNLAPRKWRRLARQAAGGSTVTPIHKSLTKTVHRGYTQNKKVINARLLPLAETLAEQWAAVIETDLGGTPQPTAIPSTWLDI